MNATILPFPSPAMDEETARIELARLNKKIAELNAEQATIQERWGWTDSICESILLLWQAFELAANEDEMKKTINTVVMQAIVDSPGLWPTFLNSLCEASKTHHSFEEYLDFCLTYQAARWEHITGSTTCNIETVKALIPKMSNVVRQLIHPLLSTIEASRILFMKEGNPRGVDFTVLFGTVLQRSLRDAVGTTSE